LEFYADFGEVEGAEVEVWAEGGCFHEAFGGAVTQGLYAHTIAPDRYFSHHESAILVRERARDELIPPIEANTYIRKGLFGGAVFEGAADGAFEGGLRGRAETFIATHTRSAAFPSRSTHTPWRLRYKHPQPEKCYARYPNKHIYHIA
jgi:hypothetical protein